MMSNIFQLSSEKLSRYVLTFLWSIAGIVFVLYFAIGFTQPSDIVPGQNQPLLVNILFCVGYIVLACCILLMLWSVVRAFQLRGKQSERVFGLPVMQIRYAIGGLLLVVLLITFLFGSGQPFKVNGHLFADTLWLKITDMLINTTLVLFFLACCGGVFGIIKSFKK